MDTTDFQKEQMKVDSGFGDYLVGQEHFHFALEISQAIYIPEPRPIAHDFAC